MRRFDFHWEVRKHYWWGVKGLTGHSIFIASNLTEAFQILKEEIVNSDSRYKGAPIIILNMSDSD